MNVAADSIVELVSPEELDVGFNVESVTGTLHDGTDVAMSSSQSKISFASVVTPPSTVFVKASSSSGETIKFTVEFVSRYYFEISEIRDLKDDTDDFSDTTRYPDEAISAARRAAVEVFEKNANKCFIERIGFTHAYSLNRLVYLNHADVSKLIEAPSGYSLVSYCQAEGCPRSGSGNFVYRYGVANIPAKVKEAVMNLAKYYLRTLAWSDRAQSVDTDNGFIRLTIAGRDGATGLPEVDAAIAQFGNEVLPVW